MSTFINFFEGFYINHPLFTPFFGTILLYMLFKVYYKTGTHMLQSMVIIYHVLINKPITQCVVCVNNDNTILKPPLIYIAIVFGPFLFVPLVCFRIAVIINWIIENIIK